MPWTSVKVRCLRIIEDTDGFSDLGHEESGSLEHLAVRFKHKNAADEFKEKFEKCQEEIGEVVSETVVVPEANVEETAEQGDEDYEGYEDEEDYDENGETIMFHQTATLHIKNDTTGEFMNQVGQDIDYLNIFHL